MTFKILKTVALYIKDNKIIFYKQNVILKNMKKCSYILFKNQQPEFKFSVDNRVFVNKHFNCEK